MIQSPLNYTGGKYRLLPQILPHFPKNIDVFVDLFCGGCNVGINVSARKVLYNDSNRYLVSLYKTFKTLDKDTTFKWIYKIIDEYELSLVSEKGYEFYGCRSTEGLSAYNREKFVRMRTDFNSLIIYDDYYYIFLYVLIVYAFNNQIRFNGKGEYNLPVGKRDFNSKMANKLSKFIDKIKNQNSVFVCGNYSELDISSLGKNDFVYLDPPYLITCASYNEQGGWTHENEIDLLMFLDKLDANEIKFALSNVLRSKGNENHILIEWAEKNSHRYKIIKLNNSYSNSNYQTKDKQGASEEVLIVNY